MRAPPRGRLLGGRLLLGGVAGERDEHVVERRPRASRCRRCRRRRRRAAGPPRRSRPGAGAAARARCCSSSTGRSSATSASAAIARSASSAFSRRTSSRSPPTRSLSSSEVPSAITLPWSITTIRSASRSASSRYWVVSSTVVPAAVRASIVSHIADPAARVEAGGRLVEEQHRRAGHERGGRGPAAGACRRSRSSPAAWRPRSARSARAARPRGRAPPCGACGRAGRPSRGSRSRSGSRRRPRTGRRARSSRAARPPRAPRRGPRRGALPASGCSRVARIRTAVVLPAPLGPSRPRTLPVRAVKSTPHRARTEPYDFSSPSTTIASSIIASRS